MGDLLLRFALQHDVIMLEVWVWHAIGLFIFPPPPSLPPLQSKTPRSVEDLKERYYSIARRLLAAREGGEPAVANHTLMRYPYNR